MAKASNRLSRGARFFTSKQTFPNYAMRGALLVGHTASGAPLVAYSPTSSRPCIPTKGRALRKSDCNTQLIFTTGGPKLRFCHAKGKQGAVVPVTGPAQATALAKAFCACVKKGKTAKSCAVEVSNGAPLGRHAKRRR